MTSMQQQGPSLTQLHERRQQQQQQQMLMLLLRDLLTLGDWGDWALLLNHPVWVGPPPAAAAAAAVALSLLLLPL